MAEGASRALIARLARRVGRLEMLAEDLYRRLCAAVGVEDRSDELKDLIENAVVEIFEREMRIDD